MSIATPAMKRLYYGWFVLAACFTFMFLGVTARNSFGLFFKPILEDFRLSRAALSLPVSLSLILYGASQPMGGLLIRRFGAKKVVLWGALLTASAFLGMSQIDSIWGIYLFYGCLLGLGGIGNSFTAFTPLLASWSRTGAGWPCRS